jgi:hypothetical protein
MRLDYHTTVAAQTWSERSNHYETNKIPPRSTCAEREYAYGADSKIGTFSEALMAEAVRLDHH